MTRETHLLILKEAIRNHTAKTEQGNVQDAINRLVNPKPMSEQLTSYGLTPPITMHDGEVRRMVEVFHQHDKDLIVRMVLEAFRA